MANNIALPKNYKLNDYTLSRKLSTGGFSIVYLAYDKNGLPVAIKEFFPNSLHLRSKGTHVDFINMREKHRFQEGLKAFKDETEIVMRLKHKNIIEIINFFETNGTAYLVMPYEYGCTLSKYITTEKDSSEQEILSIISGIFSAVQMFHDNNIIHLDLKPGNIWLRPNKEALILDFGTARIIDDPIKSKQPPMHTPGYAAPEQHKEYFLPQRVGVWTDYYGLGATLYALIERKTPEPSAILKEQDRPIKLLDARRGQVSRQTIEIIEELMQLGWERRYNINLKEIIQKINRTKAPKEIQLFTSSLNNMVIDAGNQFSEEYHRTLKSIEESN